MLPWKSCRSMLVRGESWIGARYSLCTHSMKMVLAYVTNVLVKMNMFRTRCILICQDHRVCELRKHFSFLFSPFFEDLSAAQPFLLQQVNNQLVHVFLSQQNNRLFYFFLSFWIHFWLSETSQQPNNLEGHPPNLCWSVTSVAIVCPLSQFVSPVENKTMSRKLSFSQYKHLVNK